MDRNLLPSILLKDDDHPSLPLSPCLSSSDFAPRRVPPVSKSPPQLQAKTSPNRFGILHLLRHLLPRSTTHIPVLLPLVLSQILATLGDSVDASSVTISNQPGSTGDKLSLENLLGRTVDDMGFKSVSFSAFTASLITLLTELGMVYVTGTERCSSSTSRPARHPPNPKSPLNQQHHHQLRSPLVL